MAMDASATEELSGLCKALEDANASNDPNRIVAADALYLARYTALLDEATKNKNELDEERRVVAAARGRVHDDVAGEHGTAPEIVR